MSIVATGGAFIQRGGYSIHTFTTTGSFVVTTAGTADILIIGGGGGGGAGGGGAGGFKRINNHTFTTGTFVVDVGLGGAAGGLGDPLSRGSNGGDSSIDGMIALGGGGGGGGGTPPTSNGRDGGSGGGAGYNVVGLGTRGLGTAGQGNDGADTTYYGQYYGGGGGACTAGYQGDGSNGGNGGQGKYSDISGEPTFYAGGGGGYGNALGGIGGSSIGGNGGYLGVDATSPVANSGGGGGAGGNNGTDLPTDGAAGIVIIRYAAPDQCDSGKTALRISIKHPCTKGVISMFSIEGLHTESHSITSNIGGYDTVTTKWRGYLKSPDQIFASGYLG